MLFFHGSQSCDHSILILRALKVCCSPNVGMERVFLSLSCTSHFTSMFANSKRLVRINCSLVDRLVHVKNIRCIYCNNQKQLLKLTTIKMIAHEILQKQKIKNVPYLGISVFYIQILILKQWFTANLRRDINFLHLAMAKGEQRAAKTTFIDQIILNASIKHQTYVFNIMLFVLIGTHTSQVYLWHLTCLPAMSWLYCLHISRTGKRGKSEPLGWSLASDKNKNNLPVKIRKAGGNLRSAL